MSQGDKSRFYQELKAAGYPFSKHYREYSTEGLMDLITELRQTPGYEAQAYEAPACEAPADEAPAYEATVDEEPPTYTEPLAQDPSGERFVMVEGYRIPVAYPVENDYARIAPLGSDDKIPIRVDPDTNRVWYREEVKKPAFPKPRVRRKLAYVETGVKQQTVQNGQYIETFEVAGDEQRTSEVKITMPSYQVGIYRDLRFPFRIHTYNGNQGFDYAEVNQYYGGSDMVPPSVKRTYVGNDLVYDIRSVVRTIEAEARELQLKGII